MQIAAETDKKKVKVCIVVTVKWKLDKCVSCNVNCGYCKLETGYVCIVHWKLVTVQCKLVMCASCSGNFGYCEAEPGDCAVKTGDVCIFQWLL